MPGRLNVAVIGQDPCQKSGSSRTPGAPAVIRLDGAHNPFGACPAALEAAAGEVQAGVEVAAGVLRQRLSTHCRAPVGSIVLFPSIEPVLRRMGQRLDGPLVGLPPSSLASAIPTLWPGRAATLVNRGVGRGGCLDESDVADLPPGSVAIADSPSSLLGALLSPLDVVRLARACRCLIVDERYAEYAGFSLVPLALEFDNVVVLRSFDAWAGFPELPCAWAVASPAAARLTALTDEDVAPTAVAAAAATLENAAMVACALRLIIDERSRLYRFLRRLSFLTPLPSWGPFVSARVELGGRQRIVAALEARGVRVFVPAEPGLEHHIRIGIGTRSEMDRLRTALLDFAPELLETGPLIDGRCAAPPVAPRRAGAGRARRDRAARSSHAE